MTGCTAISQMHNLRDPYNHADPGFWFGRGTGRGPRRRKSPSEVQGLCEDLAAKPPQNPEEFYVMRLEKNTYGEKKNKSIQTDIV